MNFMVNVPNILSTSSERTNLRIGEVREGEERTRGGRIFSFISLINCLKAKRALDTLIVRRKYARQSDSARITVLHIIR